MRGENGISFTGLYLCGGISFVMLVLKLSVMDTWSWWRVILPLGLFVGFNVTNIVVAFIYLTFAHIPERPDGVLIQQTPQSESNNRLIVNNQYTNFFIFN